MFHVSIYANNVALRPALPLTSIRSTFDLDLHMYVYHGMRKREEKLGLVVEESVNGGIVLWKVQKKEKHGWRGGE